MRAGRTLIFNPTFTMEQSDFDDLYALLKRLEAHLEAIARVAEKLERAIDTNHPIAQVRTTTRSE